MERFQNALLDIKSSSQCFPGCFENLTITFKSHFPSRVLGFIFTLHVAEFLRRPVTGGRLECGVMPTWQGDTWPGGHGDSMVLAC